MEELEKKKKNFKLPEVILGGQDGIVNVLGVILGVAAATSSSPIVLVAGLATTFAEAISMGAVAYTSKMAEADFYESEYEREQKNIKKAPKLEKEKVHELYQSYGFEGNVLEEIVDKVTSNPNLWVDQMMSQELKLEPINRKEVIGEAFIVGLSSLIGSLIPLVSFFFFPVKVAVTISIVVSAITLFSVGYYKARTTLGRNLWKQGIQMMVIGMVSAFVGYFIGTIFKVPGM